jgi:hypothetical protein
MLSSVLGAAAHAVLVQALVEVEPLKDELYGGGDEGGLLSHL